MREVEGEGEGEGEGPAVSGSSLVPRLCIGGCGVGVLVEVRNRINQTAGK